MQAERRRIRRQMAHHERELVKLKRQYNDLLPIARLPQELLTEILLIASHGYSRPPTFGWLALTRICHRWREAALGAPAFWSRFASGERLKRTGLAFHRLMLGRSAQCDLSVYLSMHLHHLEHAKELCLVLANETHRIRDLELANCTKRGLKFFEQECCWDVSLLEVRSLSISKKDAIDEPLPWLSNFPTSRLCRLSTFGISLNACRRLFVPSITSLELSGEPGSPIASMTVMCSVRRGLPALCNLRIFLGPQPAGRRPSRTSRPGHRRSAPAT
ncbi:hypothetical protein OE88DRAFT_286466 [Heliocybe sulcata]|uniref:Uncharacterized protein n=1 Tax=Heliocybe sulcata TaxID=5364 RepID=A0A5C3N3L3_9AGAM|nr:hypothetical protein OE88DRAFT_286466 [Heliocybe sulcata]